MRRADAGDLNGFDVLAFLRARAQRRVIRDINACDCGYKHEGDGE